MTKRAAVYVRLSRYRGVDDPSTSPERQREACQAYADAQGWEVVDVVEDLDESGGKMDRPGLNAVRDRFGDLDAVIFLKLDRLSRSVVDFATFAREAQSAGVALVSVRDGLDLSTPGGRFVAQILAAFAEMELATITERIRDGKRKAKELGRWQGGGLPFGLRVKDGVLEVDDAEAAALVEAADDLLAGGSLRRSTALMEASGLRPRRSDHWVRKTVKRLLTNDYAPTILGVERAQLVAETLGENTRPTTTNPKRLLSGLLRCHSCGGTAYVNARTDGVDVYRCSAKAAGRPCAAPVTVTAGAIDAWVEQDYLGEHAAEPETVTVRVADERTAHVARLTAQIADAVTRLSAVPRAERLAALADLDALEAELDELKATSGYGLLKVRDTGRTCGEAWEAADLDERREILRTELASRGAAYLTVGPGRRGGRGFDPTRIRDAL